MENNVQKKSGKGLTGGQVGAILVGITMLGPFAIFGILLFLKYVIGVNISHDAWEICFYPTLLGIFLIIIFGPFLVDD